MTDKMDSEIFGEERYFSILLPSDFNYDGIVSDKVCGGKSFHPSPLSQL